MFANNTNIKGYKELSPDMRKNKKAVKEYNNLLESVGMKEPKYVDISQEEMYSYIHKIEERYKQKEGIFSVNESDAYLSLTPFDWIGSISLSGIFSPLKWLAAFLAGATALLLAGLIKALKEGKKQIAIARVRDWIKSLVILADGGYKKSRKTKDSLFLIEARARRDILQAAVMAGYSAGLDIPEKTNEPANPIESAKNESIDLNGMDCFLFEAKDNNPPAGIVYNGQTYSIDEEGWNALKTQLTKDGVNFDDAKLSMVKDGVTLNLNNKDSVLKAFGKTREDLNTNSQNNIEDAEYEEVKDSSMSSNLAPYNQNTGLSVVNNSQNNSRNSNGNNTSTALVPVNNQSSNTIVRTPHNIEDAEYEEVTDVSTNGPQRQLPQPPVPPQGPNDGDVSNLLNKSYNLEIMLPDDSQVDWSLLKTLKTSSWFGLVKHKTNLWKEARSVFKMRLEDVNNETDRQKYINSILINVNASLSKITTPNIARNYTNVLNQFVTSVMRRTTDGTKNLMTRDSAPNVGITVGNHGSAYESEKYSFLFREDLGLFEDIVQNQNTRQNNIQAPQSSNWIDQYAEWKFAQQNRQSELDYDEMKPLIDNTFKAMQNIFTAQPVTDFLVFVKTRDQMKNFLNELSKSVYVIIDSVAKKAKESNSFGGNGKAVDRMITGLLSSDGDPKQNRSLRNLWDNIGRPQLDSRAITRCGTLTQTPEFQYFVEMLCVTIPLCLMTLFMPNENGAKIIALVKKDGTQMNPAEIIAQNTRNILQQNNNQEQSLENENPFEVSEENQEQNNDSSVNA